MTNSACYNCGQQGHFASSCPLGVDLATTTHRHRWQPAPRQPREVQAAINEWGVALCRAALANRPNPARQRTETPPGS